MNYHHIFIIHVTAELTIHKGSPYLTIMATVEAIPEGAEGEYHVFLIHV